MPNVLSLLEKRNKMHECDHVQVHISVSSTPTKIVLAEENDSVKVSYDAECGNGSASPARDVPRPFFFAVATARRAERSTRPSIRSQASLLLPADVLVQPCTGVWRLRSPFYGRPGPDWFPFPRW